MNEEQERKFKEGFYKPSTKRDPNAAFIVTGFKGAKTNKDSKPAKDKESDKEKEGQS